MNREDCDRKCEELRAQLRTAKRYIKPEITELDSWQECHDMDKGLCWVPKTLIEEYHKHDMFRRYGIES